MKIKMNKKAVADTTDLKFWGIVVAFWIFCLIVTWRTPFGAWASMKLKIMISIAAAPIIYFICYSMGENG